MKAETIARNKVKSMTIFSCPLKNGIRDGKRFKKSETFYDKKGNVIELIEYKKGKIDKWEKYKYDNHNRIVVQTSYVGLGFDKSKYREHTKTISYDDNGNNSKYKPIIETDKEGKIVETTFYLNGKLKSRRYFNIDRICTEEIEFKNEIVKVRHKKYDKNGNILSDHNFDTKGNLTYSLTFEYDERGMKNRMIKQNLDEEVINDIKYIYDNFGNLIEEIDIFKEEYQLLNSDLNWTENNTIGYRHKYFFNENQLLTEHQLYLGENLIFIYESDYSYEHK